MKKCHWFEWHARLGKYCWGNWVSATIRVQFNRAFKENRGTHYQTALSVASKESAWIFALSQMWSNGYGCLLIVSFDHCILSVTTATPLIQYKKCLVCGCILFLSIKAAISEINFLFLLLREIHLCCIIFSRIASQAISPCSFGYLPASKTWISVDLMDNWEICLVVEIS